MKSCFYGVFILLLSLNENAQHIDDISLLKGTEIIWSSPYKKASNAKVILVKEI